MKQYLYIVQSQLEVSKCKIGITNDLNRRLKEYNAITGISSDNTYSILFAAEVSNMRALEQDIKNNFAHLREQTNREIYFYNPSLFDMYVDFIYASEHFLKKIVLKESKKPKIAKPKTPKPSMKDRGVTRKTLLDKAMRVKDDEFYTRMEDVEKELSMYPTKIWKDKVVFCNCDDAIGSKRDYTDSSAFALYFIKHFFRLKLKKLICTHYSGKVDLFNAGTKGYIFTKDGANEMFDTPKGYNGGFEETESLRILNEEADIVCTNPPFSRAIEYWQILIRSQKKFIIISNITNCVTTAFIPYFMDKKAWAGYTRVDWYLNPKRVAVEAAGHFFTNFPIKDRPNIKRLKFMPLDEIPDVYKRFDDDNILSVDKNYIPNDYDKPFGVSARQILNGVLECGYIIVQNKKYMPHINGKEKFARVLIQKS
ncbi:putative DNA EcoRI methylase [Helicobacter cinaedi PAGU611]|uniref:DNA EcoRI methylase n=2 Tax=Helicobacter cinaedi CCUG 18818 = ATCC BAA-847 TaxID=537971 RepID=A0AAI8MLD0_9HELI|nr:adenine-specific methyltransferase EcoRI family protein [Helicobacter cinaedi]QOQ90130.1 GIY-YIG nuclease family protein [Helicobacter cinaedi]BAM11743.1 putative DNA EcoRI methylase [Helicobacter cinaedi PAGU611]BAM31718.1 putative DNA EcoRI methylase [Helicobacter cinaedi CCUG 18818 = ATCC BAA-847]BBB19308.1 modification methylase EcoRI [Helicobacter cinaedi]